MDTGVRPTNAPSASHTRALAGPLLTVPPFFKVSTNASRLTRSSLLPWHAGQYHQSSHSCLVLSNQQGQGNVTCLLVPPEHMEQLPVEGGGSVLPQHRRVQTGSHVPAEGRKEDGGTDTGPFSKEQGRERTPPGVPLTLQSAQ